jgi:hypothetical protein
LINFEHFWSDSWPYSGPMRKGVSPLRVTLLLLCLGSCAPLGAQAQRGTAPQPVLTAEEVISNLVQRNLDRARALRSYEGSRIYRLEYRGFPGFRTAEMVVGVRYDSPATKQFTVRSESGSKLVIERVFKKLMEAEREALSEENQSHVALNNDNYTFVLQGYEPGPSGSMYVLSVEPRVKNKLLFRGKIWVNADDFAVARIEAEPAKNPSFWTKESKIELVYGRVGDFWLPISNRSSSTVRLGGHASLTIDYRDYRILSAAPLIRRNESIAEYP